MYAIESEGHMKNIFSYNSAQKITQKASLLLLWERDTVVLKKSYSEWQNEHLGCSQNLKRCIVGYRDFDELW